MGLWSQWSEQTITIINVPGDDVALTVVATHKARLSWTDHDKTCYVLRDSALIEKTDSPAYTDEFTIGKHVYQILEALDDDNYTLSNIVTVTLFAEHAMISAIDDVSWLLLTGSRERHPEIKESMSQSATLVHYIGRSLPVVETDGFLDKTLSFTIAFKDQSDCDAFEALLGRIVCYKNSRGRLIVGLLNGVTPNSDLDYWEYSCAIYAIDQQNEVAYE